MKLNWNEVRVFLAVVDHGSTIRAATVLGMDQTTCARRIGALEDALGLRLFDRDGGRYEPTADALALVPSARVMSGAGKQLSELAAMRQREQRHKLRVTADEALASAFVIPAVGLLSSARPDLDVEMDVTAVKRDLLAGEADVAVRGGLEPEEPTLVRRKLCDDPVGLYAAQDYVHPPSSAAELKEHPLACFDVAVPRLEEHGLGANIRHVVNSATALRAIIERGQVIGLMPRSIAEIRPALRLCLPLPFPIAIWLVYPERLRGRPEIIEFSRLLDRTLREARERGTIG